MATTASIQSSAKKKGKLTPAAASADPVGPTGLIPPEAIQAAAKELHMAEVNAEVASFIATTVEYHLREVLEDAIKVQTQSRRRILTVDDLTVAMRLRGQQPIYGYGAGAQAMRDVTTVDGRQSQVILSELGERREALVEAMQTELPKVPREVGLLLHWLAIDGTQPLIPQNPPPVLLSSTPAPLEVEGGALVIPEKTHPLSQELWHYYKKIVQGLMTPSTPEREKRHFFAALGSETGLHELVPYLSLHVHNTVTHAVGAGGRGPLDPLWAAMRIFRCMVVNPNMHLELYLHQMLPSVMTVIANNRLAATSVSAAAAAAVGGGERGGENGDHYALRIFAAQTLAMLVRTYGGVYRPLASVICKTFAERVEEFLGVEPAGKGALATLYGTITGIVHLGARPVEVVLLPVAGQVLGRLKGIMEDRGVKLRKRVEAQNCYSALVAAVGEARERRMGEPLAAVRIEMLGGIGVGVGVGGVGGGGEGDEGRDGGGRVEGNWKGTIAAESLVPFAAQSLAYPEHLLAL